jgi:hypothetical protein
MKSRLECGDARLKPRIALGMSAALRDFDPAYDRCGSCVDGAALARTF